MYRMYSYPFYHICTSNVTFKDIIVKSRQEGKEKKKKLKAYLAKCLLLRHHASYMKNNTKTRTLYKGSIIE